MGEWVKSRGINGEWGYMNLKTLEFRTTLPDSKEEKELERLKRNKAVLTTHSANKTRFNESEANTRNYSSETRKKRISVPVISSDNLGNFSAGHVTTLAPGADSVGGVDPLALFYVEGVALGPMLKGAGRLAEYGLAKGGDTWARGRILSRNLNTTVNNGFLQDARKQLEGYWLDLLLNFGKNSGKLIHGDSGDKVGMFRKRGQGAVVKDGKLHPGKGLLEIDYSWWNLDKPYLESHLRTSDNPVMPIPTRWLVVDESERFINPRISDLRIGQSNKGKGLILKTERVSDTPVDLSNALVLLRDPLLQTWNRIIYQGERPIEMSQPYVRWSLKGYLNEALAVYPKGASNQYFEIVKDVDNPVKGKLQTNGNGLYSLHFKTDRNLFRGNEKENMFQTLADLIPEGGVVSTWGTVSPGGYHAINRFGNQFKWPKIGERPGVNGAIPEYLKPYLGNSIEYFDEPISLIKWIETPLRGTVIDESPYTVTIHAETELDPLSLQLASKEMKRRFENLGYNVDNTKIAGLDGVLRSINDFIDHNLNLKNYIADISNTRLSGMYSNPTGNAYVIPEALDPVSALYHERAMHGTDIIMGHLAHKQGLTKAEDLYTDFLYSVIHSERNPITAKSIWDDDGVLFHLNGRSYLLDAINVREARATIGEMVRLYYNDIYNPKSTISLKELRNKFEKYIDSISDDQLLSDLYTKNSYGKAYADIGKHNPNFIKIYRKLLKVAPATLPGVLTLNLKE